MVSLTSQLSGSLHQEEVEEKQSSVEVGRKLSVLVQQYEQLQDSVNLLLHQQQQGGGRAARVEDRELSRVSQVEEQRC